MKKLENGYMLYGRDASGALAGVFIPSFMPAKELIAVLADMKPKKEKATKKKGGDGE